MYSSKSLAFVMSKCRASLGWTDEGICPYVSRRYSHSIVPGGFEVMS